MTDDERPKPVPLHQAAYVRGISIAKGQFGTPAGDLMTATCIDFQLERLDDSSPVPVPKIAITESELAQVVNALVEAGGCFYGPSFPLRLLAELPWTRKD